MTAYAVEYREQEANKKTHENEKISTIKKYDIEVNTLNNKMDELRSNISTIDAELKSYNDSIQLLSNNYEELIKELEDKIIDIEAKIQVSDKDIGEWNDMNELFSKTLRYSLLDTLIPHINKSIKYYLNKLNQLYNVEYDQEFKPHIYFEGNEKEISYSDLSTGQKKTLDIGIIFGVIANVIANVEFNIFFLDELFSNMDANSRNIMLELIKDNFKENKTIFIVNHAEM
jgi:DNA repair exonuclease SbcCD ATPase subunit